MDTTGKISSPFESFFNFLNLLFRMSFERFSAAVAQTITPEERGAQAAGDGLLNLAMQAL